MVIFKIIAAAGAVASESAGWRIKGVGSGGHVAGASGLTTRTKKYAVKKAPNSIASEAMKRNIPSVAGSSRELRLAGGGPW